VCEGACPPHIPLQHGGGSATNRIVESEAIQGSNLTSDELADIKQRIGDIDVQFALDYFHRLSK
jgi:hypothetical protein